MAAEYLSSKVHRYFLNLYNEINFFGFAAAFLYISLTDCKCICAPEHSSGFCSETWRVQCFEILQVLGSALG